MGGERKDPLLVIVSERNTATQHPAWVQTGRHRDLGHDLGLDPKAELRIEGVDVPASALDSLAEMIAVELKRHMP